MSYVDGFVLAVPTADREKYRAFAAEVAPLFKDNGALEIFECWGDDVPDGEVTSFPMAVKCQPDETVVFSWIVWPSHAVRAAAWEKLREDPRMETEGAKMPFDGKRLIYGGFDMVLDA